MSDPEALLTDYVAEVAAKVREAVKQFPPDIHELREEQFRGLMESLFGEFEVFTSYTWFLHLSRKVDVMQGRHIIYHLGDAIKFGITGAILDNKHMICMLNFRSPEFKKVFGDFDTRRTRFRDGPILRRLTRQRPDRTWSRVSSSANSLFNHQTNFAHGVIHGMAADF